MTLRTSTAQLLKRTLALLPVTDEDVVFKGITAELTDRIVELKKNSLRLEMKYGSLEQLEQEIKRRGVSPDDHTLYTDLLDWRAINHELAELVKVLESL